jgi:hypothetical protein
MINATHTATPTVVVMLCPVSIRATQLKFGNFHLANLPRGAK